MNEWKDVFEDKGISPSYTRTRIYGYLEHAKSHPTVDEIYKALKDELPTLSKTTVYNVLKLFMEHDIAKSVNMSGNEQRYELAFHKHSHFKCVECGTIYDIPYIKPQYHTHALDDFDVLDEEVNLSGICKKCKQKALS